MNETTTVETTYPALFPLSALKTRGYAQPEPRDETDTAADEEPTRDPNQIAFDFGPAVEDAA